MNPENGNTAESSKLIHVIADFTANVARSLNWYDLTEPWPKRLDGASCFVLKFDTQLVGITANHVVEAFERAKDGNQRIACFLRTSGLDLLDAIIDRDRELDLATFEVTQTQLKECAATAVDCREQWPPPIPDQGREISFAGFPGEFGEPWPKHRIEFRSAVDVTHVEAVTERNVVAIYDPKRDRRIVAAPAFPEIGGNWSGCSGGPVLMYFIRRGIIRWFPIALITEGPGKPPAADWEQRGEMSNLDQFILRRIDRIQMDGRIEHPNVGWLPSTR
jgi:hypothetical protein